MRQIAEFTAVLSCALFTGASVYITFIEHPARMQCGVELAATEYVPSYRRATVMQASRPTSPRRASLGAKKAHERGRAAWFGNVGMALELV
jgi:hypothetical protein